MTRIERKQTFYDFDNWTTNCELLCKLVDIRLAGFENNVDAVNYVVQTQDMQEVIIGASAWLANKIRKDDIGKTMWITFLGFDEKNKKRGQQPAKMFKVEIDE